MENQERKETIERVLLALVGIADNAPLILHGYLSELVKALAEQAILIRQEVTGYKPDYNRTHLEGENGEWIIDVPGELTEETYLFIGLPLPPKEEPE